MTSAGRVEVTTSIKAPREKVFDAWLSADRMARFLCAGDTHVASVEVDPRVGGAFRIVMANAKGSYDHRGRYLEIERPERLRFTWASAATMRRLRSHRDLRSQQRGNARHTGSRWPAAGRHGSRSARARLAEHPDEMPWAAGGTDRLRSDTCCGTVARWMSNCDVALKPSPA
jgi:uncharacterized protein YndB with AHSA1/START domain